MFQSLASVRTLVVSNFDVRLRRGKKIGRNSLRQDTKQESHSSQKLNAGINRGHYTMPGGHDALGPIAR